MPSSVVSTNAVRTVGNGYADPSVADLSKLSADSKRYASVKPPIGGARVSTPVRTPMGTDSVGLTPDGVKALTTQLLPQAQRTVDTTFAAYIKSAPNLQLRFWTPEQLKAANKNNADSLFAFVDRPCRRSSMSPTRVLFSRNTTSTRAKRKRCFCTRYCIRVRPLFPTTSRRPTVLRSPTANPPGFPTDRRFAVSPRGSPNCSRCKP